MSKLMRFFPSPPLMAALAAAILMSVALLTPNAVGMADNGDFYRITNGNGIYKLDRTEPDEYLSYFSVKYGVYQYFNEYEDSLPSSQTLFIKAAVALDGLFTRDPEVFDIRFLSGILIAYCAAAIYLLVDAAAYRSGRLGGYLVGAFAVFLFADTGYSAYFNSFYAEGLVMTSFLASVGSLLLLTQQRYSPGVLLGSFVANTLVLTFAKQQNAPLGLLAAAALPALAWALSREKAFDAGLGEGRENPKPYIVRRAAFLRSAVGAAALLAAAGIAVYVLIPQEFVDINRFHAMTRGVLMTSADPEDTLEEFGIDRQYALLNEAIYYERYPAVDAGSHALDAGFYSHYSIGTVALYYLRHPDKLWQMLNIASNSAYTIRPESLGNYQRSAGREPGAKTAFFALYSSLKDRLAPRTVGFIAIWTALALALSFRKKSRMLVLGYAVACGLSQIVVSIVGAGDADLAKHVFLYNAAFDCMLFLVVSDALAGSGAHSSALHVKGRAAGASVK